MRSIRLISALAVLAATPGATAGADTGTLRGSVVWAAGDAKPWLTVPYHPPAMATEAADCARGGHVQGTRRKSQRLQLGERGDGRRPGVRHTVVWLEIQKGVELPPAGTVELSIRNCEFEPHVFLISRRETRIRIRNGDSAVSHQAKGSFVWGDTSDPRFNILLGRGGQFLYASGFPAGEGRLEMGSD